LPIYFLSNGKEKRVKFFAEKYGARYKHRAKKPLPGGYFEAAKRLNTPTKNIAVIGDQLLSDILGGNLAKCFTIKIQPLDPKADPLAIKLKRMAERLFQ
jgi:HAD superfamily phosphatase (TIGR01668 family)